MKKKFSLFLMAFCAMSAMAQPPSKDYKLVFEDNFDGDTLNTQVWRYRLDHRTGMGYMDGLNRAENVYVKDGKLYIECRQEVIDGKNQNTGGGIISLKDFGYGYYECLSKPFMGGRGVHTSFWQRGSSTPNNNIFEIDSYESILKVIWLPTIFISIWVPKKDVMFPGLIGRKFLSRRMRTDGSLMLMSILPKG